MRELRDTRAGRLRVTRGVAADGAEVLALLERVLAEGRYFVTEPGELSRTSEDQGRIIADFNAMDNSVFLVGRVNRALAGVVTIAGGALRRTRHAGALEIFVDPALRGAGVGRALMEIGVQWCVDNPRLQRLALAVFEDNTRAVALYRSLGFEVEGRRAGAYRDPDGTLRSDLLMARSVSA